MEYSIVFDRNKCIGTASCERIASKTWELDGDGLAHPKKKTITERELQVNIKAAKSCPTRAIHIIDENKKQVV